MLKFKKCLIPCVLIFTLHLFFILAANSFAEEKISPLIINRETSKPATIHESNIKPVLSVTPREINLGTLAADKNNEAIFTLNNTGSGTVHWSTEGPGGWEKTGKQVLTGSFEKDPDLLRVVVTLVSKELSSAKESFKKDVYFVEMKLESLEGTMYCRKQLPLGTHKEAIQISSNGGNKTFFVVFTIVYTQKNAVINLNPLRLDMGKVFTGKTVSKRIMLTNSGKETLNWSVSLKKNDEIDLKTDLTRGRYVSLRNDDLADKGLYIVPAHLKDMVEMTGNWLETNGYPSADGEGMMKINFKGTGIDLYLLSYPDDVNLIISFDKQLVKNPEIFNDLREKKGKIMIAEALENVPHVLTITTQDSRIIFEGFKILGEIINDFPAGNLSIVPNSGATSRQVNYLNVTFNAVQLLPGYYAGNIVFNTNSGEAIVEVFAEIIPETPTKVIDVFRYFNGTDYMFTSDPEAESRKLSLNHYVKEGIAFRLFPSGTPGTTEFYRWYHPQKKSHFYHYNITGGGKDLRGYVFEGSIGNIATSKLTNTIELYRWYNSKTGHYLYTTDRQGGRINKRNYQFDGIAGYVRP